MRASVRSTFVQLKQEAERVRTPPGSKPPNEDSVVHDVSEVFDAILEPSIVVDVSFGGFEPQGQS
jgi:hypothetical protein